MKRLRRVKRYEPESWIQGLMQTEQETLEAARRFKGIICRNCHKLIPWKELEASYERQGSDIFRLWWCTRCGTLVREDNLSDRMLMDEASP